MRIRKVTPVLVVEAVEPCVEFWTTRLGFELTNSVPEGERLGFAILARDGVELMYQSVDSVAKDVPQILAGGSRSLRAALFFEVEDLDAFERALAGVRPLTPRRKTFYGADELIVSDPAGNIVTFAQFASQPA
ncbi:MAG TPA: VOC family protein [Steroidobacteraceae bacterium]|nr:VOC family protein [Steroidobacteraceae bacterium]